MFFDIDIYIDTNIFFYISILRINSRVLGFKYISLFILIPYIFQIPLIYPLTETVPFLRNKIIIIVAKYEISYYEINIIEVVSFCNF